MIDCILRKAYKQVTQSTENGRDMELITLSDLIKMTKYEASRAKQPEILTKLALVLK